MNGAVKQFTPHSPLHTGSQHFSQISIVFELLGIPESPRGKQKHNVFEMLQEEVMLDTTLKRKRVSVACDSCRAKKSKCDGRRPICGRCEGYGFHCIWGEGRSRNESLDPMLLEPPQTTEEAFELIRKISLKLPGDARTAIEEVITQFQSHNLQPCSLEHASKDSNSGAISIDHQHSSRYLGEVSDIHFLNVVQSTLGVFSSPQDSAAESRGNYDQEERLLPQRSLNSWASQLPSWKDGEKYLTTYFSTIHLAYPFVPRSYFIGKFKAIESRKTSDDELSTSWLSLFYCILALGAFYDTFAEQDQSSPSTEALPAQYFRQSILLTNTSNLEASTVQISALLAQCFYLLATSSIDRCWITLGVAIRLAQTLGLHMDFAGGTRVWSYPLPVSQRVEIRRRVWYCLYVMDRLVALQVGRPPAISDDSFHVSLPSNLDDIDYNWEVDGTVPKASEPSSGVYFLNMIELSRIIGHIVQELNKPEKAPEVRLSQISHFDNELSHWKQSLPSYLQFDNVHIFDKSLCFKRQRNMLAIKYHHLRQLMHRQYLSTPFSSRAISESLMESQLKQAQRFGEICIFEAHKTVHLFCDVRDESQLVFEYPWWQLISCVVCAASILTVATAVQRPAAETLAGINPYDDAITCLKILSTLSNRLPAARRARDQISKLMTLAFQFTVPTSIEPNNSIPRTSSEAIYESESRTANSFTVEDEFGCCPTEDEMIGYMNPAWLGGTFDPSLIWSSQLLNSMASYSTSDSVLESLPQSGVYFSAASEAKSSSTSGI